MFTQLGGGTIVVDVQDTKLALDLVDAAYLAGSGNSQWDDFTKAFGNAFPEMLTVMAGYDRRIKSAEVFASANVTEESLTAYHSYYHKVNIYLQKGHLWKNFPDVTYWNEILTKEEIFSSEFYQDFISKQGPYYEAFAGVIFREESRFLALTCNYGEKQRKNAERATSLLRVIGPHLQRAFELHRQIDGDQIYTQMLERSFDHIKASVFLMDQNGKIYFANKRGENLLSDGHVVTEKNKCLQFKSSKDQNAVFQDIHNLKQYAPAHSPKLIRLETPFDSPYVAFVSVLVDQENPAILNNKELVLLPHHLLLFVLDPKDQPIVKEDMVVSVLGCTSSEAKVAQSLMAGLNLQKHAEKEGISYNTARRHLQSLFAKTETSSQVELVRRLIQTFGLLR